MHFMIFLSKFFTIPWIPLRIVELCPRAMISHTLVIVYRVNFLLLIPCSKICPDTNWFLWMLVKMTLFLSVSHSLSLFSVLIILCISTIKSKLNHYDHIAVHCTRQIYYNYTMCYYRIYTCLQISLNSLMNSIWFLNHRVKLGILHCMVSSAYTAEWFNLPLTWEPRQL